MCLSKQRETTKEHWLARKGAFVLGFAQATLSEFSCELQAKCNISGDACSPCPVASTGYLVYLGRATGIDVRTDYLRSNLGEVRLF